MAVSLNRMPLSPVTIRLTLRCLPRSSVTGMQETAAVALPFKDEAGIKAYLLHGNERHAALQAADVQPHSLKGAPL